MGPICDGRSNLSAVMPNVVEVVGEDKIAHVGCLDGLPIAFTVKSVDVAFEEILLRGGYSQRVHDSLDLGLQLRVQCCSGLQAAPLSHLKTFDV